MALISLIMNGVLEVREIGGELSMLFGNNIEKWRDFHVASRPQPVERRCYFRRNANDCMESHTIRNSEAKKPQII